MFTPKPRPKRLVKREASAAKLTAWKKLRLQVLTAYGRYCRVCARQTAYDAHHLLARSLGGADEPRNLIPVCRKCHEDIHGHVVKLRWTNEANRAGSLRIERVA